MDAHAQTVFNIVVGIAGALGGWTLNSLWNAMRELQAADRALVDRVSSIEVLVAGTYVKRDELMGHIEAIFRKLDRIEEKVDRKADRVDGSHV